MEASLGRSFIKFTNRHSNNTILHSKCHPLKLSPHPSPLLLLRLSQHTPLATLSLSNPNSHARNHFPNWKPSMSTPSSFQSNVNTPISTDRFARICSGHNDKSFEWKFAADGVNDGSLGSVSEDKQTVVTAVVLGWLGSKQKHLRRYAELFNLFGMDAVTFAAPVNDVLGFHWGRKLETRVVVLTDELVSWLEEKENDGSYGTILNRLQGRQDLLEKIKGCVVDSGGDPELDPKVWAAGFATTILQKQSSVVNSSIEAIEVQNKATNVNAYEKEPAIMEVFLLTLFEKFFAYVLEIPDIKKSIGYFLEPLIVLVLFGKKPLSIKVKGITNDPKDPSVDTFRSTTLPLLKRFGVPSEGLELKIESRGVAPKGGGEVTLSVPIVHNSLKAVTWTDEGMVKRIRGISFSTRVSVQFENTMIHAARGIFNRLLPDVHIFTDHKAGAQAGKYVV